MLCEYGCGQEAKYQFKNGKWGCSVYWQGCPNMIRKCNLPKIGRPRPHTEEACLKMSESHKGIPPWNKGKPWAGEVKRKISEANKGRESKNKGKTLEEIYGFGKALEIKEKIRVSKTGKPVLSLRGRSHVNSEETRRKISEGLRGRKLSEETKRKIS